MAVFWDVAYCSNSSETSVSIYQTTRCYIPEDRHLNTRRNDNLRSHIKYFIRISVNVHCVDKCAKPKELLFYAMY
jgi:hypothetical protein